MEAVHQTKLSYKIHKIQELAQVVVHLQRTKRKGKNKKRLKKKKKIKKTRKIRKKRIKKRK
jgi:hypothetical protein